MLNASLWRCQRMTARLAALLLVLLCVPAQESSNLGHVAKAEVQSGAKEIEENEEATATVEEEQAQESEETGEDAATIDEEAQESQEAGEDAATIDEEAQESEETGEDAASIVEEAGLSTIPSRVKARRLESAVVKKTDFPIQLMAGGFHEGDDVFQLFRPYDVARDDSTGSIYVSDMMNHRIQRWSDGVPETVFGGTYGGGDDQLRFPRGIMLQSGSLYIADSGNHRILQWDVTGGSSVGVVVAGELGVLYDRQGQIRGYDATCCRSGSGVNQLRDPHGVFVTTAGDVYIADTGNDRIQKVSGGVATIIAGDGMASPGANSVLKRPEGIFVTSSYFYVSDTGQQRVVRYGLAGGDGVVVAGGNGFGSATDQLSYPTGIFVDENAEELGVPINNVYVVDTANHRVMRVRDDTFAATIVAGDCLESPTYITPCIGGGLHDPLRPGPDTAEELNPSGDNPPIYHFLGPTGLDVTLGTPVNLTVADTLNHRVLMWYRSDT